MIQNEADLGALKYGDDHENVDQEAQMILIG